MFSNLAADCFISFH